LAQSSRFWTTGTSNDGASTYGQDDITGFWRDLLSTDRQASEGVLAGVLNELAVSGTASPIAVASGSALGNGFYYNNSASLSIAVPTPTNGTTAHRVVLRVSYTARTVRAALLSGTDGSVVLPALTQSEGTIFEVPLASLTIDTGGAVTITDARDYCHFGGAPIYRRQGGSTTAWNTAGTTSYKPGGVKVQRGTVNLTWSSNERSDVTTVTFPSAFSQTPLVHVQIISSDANARKCFASVETIGKTTCGIRGLRVDLVNQTLTLPVMWRAAGAE